MFYLLGGRGATHSIWKSAQEICLAHLLIDSIIFISVDSWIYLPLGVTILYGFITFVVPIVAPVATGAL